MEGVTSLSWQYLDTRPPIKAVLQELDTFAQAYGVIYNASPCEDERLAVSYGRIRSLGITTAVPLLAWLRTIDPEQLPLEDHIRAVKATESWASRRAFVGSQTRGYGAHLSRVLRGAQQAHAGDLDIADAVVAGLQVGHLNWPSDDDVRSAFLRRRYYGLFAFEVGVSGVRVRS